MIEQDNFNFSYGKDYAFQDGHLEFEGQDRLKIENKALK